MTKRFLSILLSVFMIVSCLSVYAETADNDIVSDELVTVSSDADIASDADITSDAEINLMDESVLSDSELGLEPMAGSNSFKATFDSLEAGKAFNSANGASNFYSTGFIFANEATGGMGSVSRKASYTNVNIIECSNGDNAVEFISNGSEADSVFIGTDAVGQTVSAGDVIHFGFDFKTDDMNCVKGFSFKDASYGYLWDFLKFETNGTVTFHGKIVMNYDTGVWYDVDMYYVVDTGVWHLFVNNQYTNCSTKKVGITCLNVIRLRWTAPKGSVTKVYTDNLQHDYATNSDYTNAAKMLHFERISFLNSALSISSSSKNDSVDSSRLNYPNYTADGGVKYEFGQGKFSKASSDKSLHIYNNEGYYSSMSFGFSDYGYPSATIEKGTKFHYGVSLAIDDNTNNSVWIQAILSNNRPNLFEVSADGSTVKILNQVQQGLTFAKNQWYRLDFIMTVGEDGVSNNTLDVYINGKKVNSSALGFSAGTSANVAISAAPTIRTASYTKTGTASETDPGYDASKTKYASNSFWADDIVAVIYKSSASVVSPALTFMNPNVSVYNDRVENIGSATVAEFKDGSYLNLPYYIADVNGMEVTDENAPAKGKTLVAKTKLGGDIYIPIYHIPFPADYFNPTVTISAPSDGSNFVYGITEKITFKADAAAYGAIEDVSFYLNGSLLVKDTAAPYEYEWEIPEISGNNTIKAVLTDYYGTTVESAPVSFNIQVNQAPSVSITGVDAETNIYLGDDVTFTATSSDTDGTVVKTEIYLNNEIYDTFTTASKEFNLELPQNGRFTVKAVAYDEYGKAGYSEFVINVLNQKTVEVASLDFEGYTEGRAFSNNEVITNSTFTGSAIAFAGERGKKEIAMLNGNKFLKCGVAANTTAGSSAPYIAATYEVANAVVEYETDIIFSRNDINHNANCRGKTKLGTDLHMYAFRFSKDGTVDVQNGSSYVSIGNYEPNTWYRLKVKLDIPNHTIDLSFTNLSDPTDKCEAVGYAFQYSDYYRLIHIRMDPAFNADVLGYIGYDNMLMSYTANFPSVSGFTDNLDTVGGVAANAESVICVMSEAVGEITADDILLENDYGVVTVKSVEVDGYNVIITPKDGFVSSANYKFTLKSTAPLASGEEIGFDTVAAFATNAADFDLTKGSFTSGSSGITFTADIVNTTSQSKNITIVTATYKGDTLVNVYSKTYTVSSSKKYSSDPIAVSEDFDSVKAFVITDWTTGVPLSAKTYTISK